MDDEYWSKENMIGTGAGISSSAKITGNQLIFGAHDNFVYSLNSKTGELLWKFKTNDVVYSTPALYKNMIYVGSYDGFIYALNLDGNLEWKFNTFNRIMNTALVAVNDTLLFGTDGGDFFSMSLDGKVLWKFQTDSAIRTTPACVNDRIIFGSHDHNLYCLNENGQLQWKFLTGGPMWTCPSLVDEKGMLLWSLRDQHLKTSDNFRVYFGGFDSKFYCINQDGKFIWNYHTGGPTVSGPEYENENIYFGSSNGRLFSLDSNRGLLNWDFKTSGRMGHSSPVLTTEHVFISDYIYDNNLAGGNVYCLDKKGVFQWKFSADSAIVGTPLIHNDTLFIGSWDGHMYAISLKKQQLLWKFKTLFNELNFDVATSMKHIQSEEEKSKRIFSVWKPETLQNKQDDERNVAYGKPSRGYGVTETTVPTDLDQKRFSYSTEPAYKTKRAYDTKESEYS